MLKSESAPVIAASLQSGDNWAAMREIRRPAHTSAGDLLRTKLSPPAPTPGIVSRPALLARLDEGLARKLVLLSAPAGFGKTTLLADWVAARGDRVKVAWLSLDPGDSDPARFWRYVVTGCQSFDADLARSVLPC